MSQQSVKQDLLDTINKCGYICFGATDRNKQPILIVTTKEVDIDTLNGYLKDIGEKGAPKFPE